MRKFEVYIETTWSGVGATESFEMPEDATEEEIQDEAREIFSNYCSYGYREIEDE